MTTFVHTSEEAQHRTKNKDEESQILTDTHEDTLFFVCSYTDNEILAHIPKGARGQGIYSWKLNEKTGKLTREGLCRVGPNPAFLLKHSTKDIIYASTECIHKEACGEVITLALEGGVLREVGRRSAGGRSTCYLTEVATSCGKGLIAAVNYWDAIVSLLPLTAEGVCHDGPPCDAHMQPEAQYVFDVSPDREEHWTFRQRWAHTHCWVTEPYTQRLHFVPDLGQDKIWWYSVDEDVRGQPKLRLRGGVQLERAQGPRHAVFHPRLPVMYIVNELKSTVSVLRYNAPILEEMGGDVLLEQTSNDANAVLFHMQTIRVLPADFESNDHHKSHASEMRLHPSGHLLFVANRGHDSIAVLKIDEAQQGVLELLAINPSGGLFPRNFNFSTTGKYVVVGNQNSNDLTSFKLDEMKGTMTPTHTVYMPSPNFVFSMATSLRSSICRAESETREKRGMCCYYMLLPLLFLFWCSVPYIARTSASTSAYQNWFIS